MIFRSRHRATRARLSRWCAVALVWSIAACTHAPTREAGWITLIDGEVGLENFERIGTANWRAANGAIEADGGEGYLVTRSVFRDVQIRAEFWASANANSGIFVRVTDRGNITPMSSYEVNIWDTRPDPTFGTGAIVGFAKVSPMPRAAGRWNTYDIIARGSRVVVVLNGEKTVELDDASFAAGPIALQSAGGTIRFRKLEVKPL